MTIKEIWERIGEIGLKQDDAILWHGYQWAKERGPGQQTEMLLRLVELQREDRKRLLDECARLTSKTPMPPIVIHSTKEGILWRGLVSWLKETAETLDLPDAAFHMAAKARIAMAMNSYGSGSYLLEPEEGEESPTPSLRAETKDDK